MQTADVRPLVGLCPKIVVYSTLYPSWSRPSHGIFVENRLRHLLASGQVEAKVVAPVPWFPFSSAAFGKYADLARTPKVESRYGIEVSHPRYWNLPKVGMSLAPFLLAAGTVLPLARLRRRWNFDAIDAHYFYPDGVAAVLLGILLRKPVAITARGTDINLIPRFAVPRRLIQFAARRAAMIITVSQALKIPLVELGVPEERVVVLRNGVDLQLFRPSDRESVRARLGFKDRALLSVGHLIERKGHHLIISALPRLRGFKLTIVGEGPERAKLAALAEKLGVSDRVHLAGEVPHDELFRYYGAADALVLASSREGWPNVLLEAMACGTPVVATPIWGNPEIVSSPVAGLLMQNRTPEALADAVEALFQSLPNRSATRAFAEQFSWDATTAGQLEIFKGILARGSDRSRK